VSRHTFVSSAREGGGTGIQGRDERAPGGRWSAVVLHSAYRGWWAGVKGPNAAQLRVREARFAGRGPHSGVAIAARGKRADVRNCHLLPEPEEREALWPGRPNGLSLSCTARAYVPKPTRRGRRSE